MAERNIPDFYNGPVNPNPTGDEAAITIFGYIPSRALGALGAIVFILCFTTHLVYLIRNKGTRAFQSLMVLSCAMEVVGYCIRILAHYKPFIVIYYVIQYFFLVVSPIFLSAAFYLALALALRRLDLGVGHALLSFSPRIFVGVFIGLDVVCTITQVIGAAFIGVAESRQYRGQSVAISSAQANNILLSGLAIQTAAFLVFIGMSILVFYRSNRFRPVVIPRLFQFALLTSSLLVFTRTVFRLAETAEGVFGYASTHEVLFGILEFAPVGLATAIWAALSLESLLPPPAGDEFKEKWEGRTPSMGGLAA